MATASEYLEKSRVVEIKQDNPKKLIFRNGSHQYLYEILQGNRVATKTLGERVEDIQLLRSMSSEATRLIKGRTNTTPTRKPKPVAKTKPRNEPTQLVLKAI